MSEPSDTDATVLAVLQLADSFADVWPELASAAGAVLRRGSSPDELSPAATASALLVAIPGEEEKAGELVPLLRERGWQALAVVGSETEHRVAVAAMRAAADEYFALPADLEPLRSWVREQVARARAREEAARLAAEERESYDFSRLIGESPGIREALRKASRVIPRGTATILITGETGTGKEILAQAIHYNGPRAQGPFVEVNCTALPANLLEAELFGYEKGAFTDARAAKPGLFEAANGGTLLLDEIGDLPLELQAKLLRALEEKRVRRLGGLREVEVDVRIIAATHVNLGEAVRRGAFREDLFFRLSVVPIHLPPLRARGDDVLLLAERFLSQLGEEYDLPAPPIEEDVRRALLAYGWPGNVRELRNALERSLLLGDGRVGVDDLLPPGGAPIREAPAETLPFPATMEDIERAAAARMVERFEGNKSAAADALGISRTRLYRLLRGDAV